MAISAGETAPISRPIGPLMRSSRPIVNAELPQPVEAPGVGAAAAERTDIENIGAQRDRQRRIIQFRDRG